MKYAGIVFIKEEFQEINFNTYHENQYQFPLSLYKRNMSPIILNLMILFLGCQASSEGQQLLRNTNLKIGAVVTPPFLVVSQDRDGRDVWSGLIWDFVKYMQEARNVSVTVISPMDWLWGHCYGSEDCSGVGCNNCSGMIGQVNRGEVDLAVGMFHD